MCEVYLKANNGMYVCAQYGGGVSLLADRQEASTWEKFILRDAATGNILDPEKDTRGKPIVIETPGGGYVKYQVGADGSNVLAPNGTPADAEKFEMVQVVDDHLGEKVKLKKEIGTEKRVSFRSLSTGKYVCAEQGGGRFLVANRDKVGSWELFWVELAAAP